MASLIIRKSRTEDVSDPAKLLIVDHQKVERLFEEVAHAETPTQQRGLVAQLDEELSRHTAIEEEVLYPFIRRNVTGGAALMDEARHEHAQAKKALRVVAALDPSDPGFTDALKELRGLVLEHVQEEESVIFPKLAEETAAARLAELRGELERAKMADAPNPALPDETPVSRRRGSQRSPATTPPRTALGSSSPIASAVWVQPHHIHDRRWQVRRSDKSRASRVFDTKKEAVAFGKGMAKADGLTLLIAGRDGEIMSSEDYAPRR